DETRAQFGPGGFHGQDRDVAVDQRPAWDVPPVIVVCNVETAQGHQHLTEAHRERIAELELPPHLLDCDLAAVAAFELFLECDSTRRSFHAALYFNFAETLEFD